MSRYISCMDIICSLGSIHQAIWSHKTMLMRFCSFQREGGIGICRWEVFGAKMHLLLKCKHSRKECFSGNSLRWIGKENCRIMKQKMFLAIIYLVIVIKLIRIISLKRNTNENCVCCTGCTYDFFNKNKLYWNHGKLIILLKFLLFIVFSLWFIDQLLLDLRVVNFINKNNIIWHSSVHINKRGIIWIKNIDRILTNFFSFRKTKFKICFSSLEVAELHPTDIQKLMEFLGPI